MLVGDSAPDLVVQLDVGQRLGGLQAQVRECRPDSIYVSVRFKDRTLSRLTPTEKLRRQQDNGSSQS